MGRLRAPRFFHQPLVRSGDGEQYCYYVTLRNNSIDPLNDIYVDELSDDTYGDICSDELPVILTPGDAGEYTCTFTGMSDGWIEIEFNQQPLTETDNPAEESLKKRFVAIHRLSHCLIFQMVTAFAILTTTAPKTSTRIRWIRIVTDSAMSAITIRLTITRTRLAVMEMVTEMNARINQASRSTR